MMNKLFVILGLVVLLNVQYFGFADADKVAEEYQYKQYIENDLLTYDLSKTQELLASLDNGDSNENNSESSNENQQFIKALLLFRQALLTFGEAETLQAYEYWSQLYEHPYFHNPIHLVYTGSLQAMHGGAILAPNPIKKVEWANKGIKKIREGIQGLEQNESSNIMALAYSYFIQGSTFGELPDFFPEFSKTPDSLKNAVTLFSKAQKSKLNIDKKMLIYLVSHCYYNFGNYYLVVGKFNLSRKYYMSAKKYLEKISYSGLLLDWVESKISDLQ